MNGGPSFIQMRDAVPQVTQLKDYTPPAFRISHAALDVDIEPGQATIRATLQVSRNPGHGNSPLILDGESLQLISVAVDGRILAPGEFKVDSACLSVANVPDAFTLQTVVRFDPWRTPSSRGSMPRRADW